MAVTRVLLALALVACTKVPIASVPDTPMPYCAKASIRGDTVELCASTPTRCMQAVSMARRYGGSVGVDGVEACMVRLEER